MHTTQFLVDTTWIEACQGAGAVARRQGPRKVAWDERVGGLMYLLVPKSGSSTSRRYMEVLSGAHDGQQPATTDWKEASQRLFQAFGTATTLTFVRDPAARFLSAVTTVLLRGNATQFTPSFIEAPDAVVQRLLRERCLHSERQAVPLRQSAARRAANVLCVLGECERRGPYWNEHLVPQIAYYAQPSVTASDSPTTWQPSPVHAAQFPEGEAGLPAMLRGWKEAVQRAGQNSTPGLAWSGSVPHLPAFHASAYNNHTDLALATVADSHEAAGAAVEEVWQILRNSRFEERIRNLYDADYRCLWWS